MKKSYLISPLYLLSIFKSAYSQGGTPPELRDMFAGYWINFENQKNCTASFIVNKQGVNGLLTSAQCCVNNNCLNGNAFDTAYENEDDGSVTKIGQVHDAQFGGSNGLDYAFLSLDSVDWKPFNYVAGLTGNDTINNGTITELYPVTADFTPTEPGLAVCASGQGSGYLCGNLTELDLYIAVPNPWNGRPTVLNVNKVDLGATGFKSEEDIGGPVYVQNDNSDGTITSQALGHIVDINNDDPNHKVLYYMPIDKVLNVASAELLTYKEEGKVDATEIKYSEWNDAQNVSLIGPEIVTYVSAGNRIGVEIENSLYRTVCSTNFAVVQNGWKNGILTAGYCDEGNFWRAKSNKPIVFLGGTNTEIGYISKSEVGRTPDKEYAFVETSYLGSTAKSLPCVSFPTDKEGEFTHLAVTSGIIPAIGTDVCFVGARSRSVYYGKVVGLDERQGFYFRGERQNAHLLIGLGKVELNEGSTKPAFGDIGGPFFVKDSETTAQALGHFLGGGLSRGKIRAFYMPIARTLKDYDLELKTASVCPTTQEQQQAQIEVPPKK